MQTEGAPDTQQIGIFGGSFNPPHSAHLIIAEMVREQFALDRILWIPNRRSPFKQERELAAADDRLAMTRLATRGNDTFLVSDAEIQRPGTSYTVDTIRALQAENPEVAYRLIVGSDSLGSFSDWRDPEELLRRVRLIVFRRPGHERVRAPAGFEHRVDFADAPLLELSSTSIRARRRAGQTIRYLVPEPVYEYIVAKGLYSK